MVILGLLALTAVRTLPPAQAPPAQVRRLAVAAAALTFALLLTGSSVVASGADAACHAWPLCGSGLQPDFAGVNAFTMAHRFGAGLVAIFVAYVAIRAWPTRPLRPAAALTLVALVLQVAAGGAAAVIANGAADGLHVALGSAVWLAVALGGALAAGGAHAVNCWFDRDIDAAMRRTSRRPVPTGRIPAWHALLLGMLLNTAAFVVLAALANLLAAALALLGTLIYVFVYTVWLKRATPQNIVIGGAAGAIPPLVGWAAV